MKKKVIFLFQFGAWIKELQESLNKPPKKTREPLFIDTGNDVEQIGSIEKKIATRLVEQGLLIKTEQGLFLKKDAVNQQLHEVALWLYEQGLAGQWRNEQLAVTDKQGAVHGRIERAAVRTLGITTFAVHLIGLCDDGRVWLQRRALGKATDPGKLDTLVGGLVTVDESLEIALQRETKEEAGLVLQQLPKVNKGGEFLVQCPIDSHTGGYMIEHCYWYKAHIPNNIVPTNQDGEVSEFVRFLPAKVFEQMLAGNVAAEACLIFSQLFSAPN